MQKNSWPLGGKVRNPEQESRLHHRYTVVVQDLATQWIQSYPCKTKSAQETQSNLRKFSRTEEKLRFIILTLLWDLVTLAKSWIGIMRDLLHTDPKLMELQNELYDEWKKALRQYWFSLDFNKAGGQKQWSVIAISEMCRTYTHVARRHANDGSIHHLMGRLLHLEQK